MSENAIFALIPIMGMAVGIIAIISNTVKRMLVVKEKQIEAQTLMTAEKTAQYAAHTERLEQRMRVLERIITDKGLLISDEIETLRSLPN